MSHHESIGADLLAFAYGADVGRRASRMAEEKGISYEAAGARVFFGDVFGTAGLLVVFVVGFVVVTMLGSLFWYVAVLWQHDLRLFSLLLVAFLAGCPALFLHFWRQATRETTAPTATAPAPAPVRAPLSYQTAGGVPVVDYRTR